MQYIIATDNDNTYILANYKNNTLKLKDESVEGRYPRVAINPTTKIPFKYTLKKTATTDLFFEAGNTSKHQTFYCRFYGIHLHVCNNITVSATTML